MSISKNTGSKKTTEDKQLFAIRVECYEGYRGDESPLRFSLNQRKITVVNILDRWLDPDHRYFKIRGDDQATYIIRHDVTTDLWELTMFNVGSF